MSRQAGLTRPQLESLRATQREALVQAARNTIRYAESRDFASSAPLLVNERREYTKVSRLLECIETFLQRNGDTWESDF